MCARRRQDCPPGRFGRLKVVNVRQDRPPGRFGRGTGVEGAPSSGRRGPASPRRRRSWLRVRRTPTPTPNTASVEAATSNAAARVGRRGSAALDRDGDPGRDPELLEHGHQHLQLIDIGDGLDAKMSGPADASTSRRGEVELAELVRDGTVTATPWISRRGARQETRFLQDSATPEHRSATGVRSGAKIVHLDDSCRNWVEAP